MSDLTYVLPIRRFAPGDRGLDELTDYLRDLAAAVELVIVDGSDDDLFRSDAERWGSFARHVRPDPTHRMDNGKAWGVHTGIAHASNEFVVIADDDVRYTPDALAAVRSALAHADLVRPQNYFDPVPWHAAWDTARTLINRAWSRDSPGTLAVRRSFFLAMGGYDGKALYENCELIRTVAANAGRIAERPDLYVARRPPAVSRFWGQRCRQAYDDFAQPIRMAVFLSMVPGAVWMWRIGLGWPVLLAVVLGSMALAAAGRWRYGGATVFPVSAVWWAPVWVTERAVCSWVAVAARLRGGIPYADRRLRLAAHSLRRLRRGSRVRPG